MVNSDADNVRRGRMTETEKAEIERLVSETRLSSPLEIARLINRLPGTVYWYMVTNGLFERRRRRAYRVFLRKGEMVRGFTEREDRMIETLRIEGHTLSQIAERLTREFGAKRSYQSVQGRLAFLAAEPDECDVVAACVVPKRPGPQPAKQTRSLVTVPRREGPSLRPPTPLQPAKKQVSVPATLGRDI